MQLKNELDSYLGESITTATNKNHVKALVSPHAGYRYSGPTAAWGFKNIDCNAVDRIFVLGPSHHVYLNKCALPQPNVSKYDTPFGKIDLDLKVLTDLRQTGQFATLSNSQDEDEHSIEMQLPYIKYCMGQKPFTLVPIVVGSVSPASEARFGQLLAQYFDDESTLFIISSDFCHWGTRFQYAPTSCPHVARACNGVGLPAPRYHPEQHPVNGTIEALDRWGMSFVSNQDVQGFQRYLEEQGNTICGRHPICVLLEILRHSRTQCTIRFVHYSHSQAMPSRPGPDDSCVAYAAGICEAVAVR